MRAIRYSVITLLLCATPLAATAGQLARKAPRARLTVKRNAPAKPARRMLGALGALIRPGNLRASLMGLSDGIASTFGLVMATTAMAQQHGPITDKSVLLTGLAAMISGASSMASGEYSSVSYDNEQLLASGERGARLNSPSAAAASSFVSFVVGAGIPMAPLVLGMTGMPAVVASGALSIGTLVATGGKLARLSGRSTWRSTLRLAAAASIGVGVSWFAGTLLGANVP